MSTKFFRENQITSQPGRPGLYPFSKATWRRWIRSGDAPAPIKLGPGVAVWSETQLEEFEARRAGLADGLGRKFPPALRKNPCPPTTRPDAKRPGRPRKVSISGGAEL